MKFGKTLRDSQLLKWRARYCDYKYLKRIIKQIRAAQDAAENTIGGAVPSIKRDPYLLSALARSNQVQLPPADSESFVASLSEVFYMVLLREMQQVGTFYSRKAKYLHMKHKELRRNVDRALASLPDSAETTASASDLNTLPSFLSLQKALTIYRQEVNELAVYCELNYVALIAIVHKFTKHVKMDSLGLPFVASARSQQEAVSGSLAAHFRQKWTAQVLREPFVLAFLSQDTVAVPMDTTMDKRAHLLQSAVEQHRGPSGELVTLLRATQELQSQLGCQDTAQVEAEKTTPGSSEAPSAASGVVSTAPSRATARLLNTLEMTQSLSASQLHMHAMDASRLLQFAVRMNDIEAVNALLPKTGASIDQVNDQDCAPLHLAVGCGFLSVAKALIDSGACIDVRNSVLRTPLHLACGHGHVECVELLLKRNADVAVESHDLRTVLHHCVVQDKVDCLQLCLDRFVEVSHQEDSKETENTVPSLQEFVDALDANGTSALMLCAVYNSIRCAELLLRVGASVDPVSWRGRQALHIAAKRGSQGVTRLLLSAKARPMSFDVWGRTPMHEACHQGHKEVLALLLDRCGTQDPSITPISSPPASPGGSSRRHSPQSLTSFLNDFSLDVSGGGSGARSSPTRWQPIDTSKKNSNAVVRIHSPVMNKGSGQYGHRVNALDHQDIEGWCALHDAASTGHFDCARLLIDAGATADLRDRFDWTPRSYAYYGGWMSLAELLPKPVSLPPVPSKYVSYTPDADESNPAEDLVSDTPKGTDRSLQNSESAMSSDTINIASPRMSKFILKSSMSQSDLNVDGTGGRVSFELDSTELKADADNAVGTQHQHRSQLRENASENAGACQVTFRVNAATLPHQYLCIVGEGEKLGEWKPGRAVTMEKEHKPNVQLPHGIKTGQVQANDEVTTWSVTIDFPCSGKLQTNSGSSSDSSRSRRVDGNGLQSVLSPVMASVSRHKQVKTGNISDLAANRAQASSLSYKYLVMTKNSVATTDVPATERRQEAKAATPRVTPYSSSISTMAPSPSRGVSLLERWESLPTNRRVTLTAGEHVLVDDGVFGVRAGQTSDTSLTNGEQGAPHVWEDQGWLISELQLRVSMGHRGVRTRRPPLLLYGSDTITNAERHAELGSLDSIATSSNGGQHNRPMLPKHVKHVIIRCGGLQYEGSAWVPAQRVVVENPAAGDVFTFRVPLGDCQSDDALELAVRAKAHLQFELYSHVGPAFARAYVVPTNLLIRSGGAMTVPLIAPQSHLVIGELNFEYVLIKPFIHPLMDAALARTYAKSVRLIGHRGAGADNSAVSGLFRRTHVTENTILSFATAGSLGAQYVEFDVQLTRDGVCVVFHDFLLKLPGKGLCVPVASLTFDDFKKLRSKRIQRRHSFSGRRDDPRLDESQYEMIRQDAGAHGGVSDDLSSLEEVFKLVPPSVGFNIEIKYPLDSELDRLSLTGQDRNVFVDAVLQCTFSFAGQRPIIFSSFDPDVCVMAARKQPRYPVFFLTDSGNTQEYDDRCNSIRAAVRFATSCHLSGIVCNSTPLVAAPELIEPIKSAGLLLATYGPQNNDVDAVALQKKYGVDTVIVDHVGHIARSMGPEK